MALNEFQDSEKLNGTLLNREWLETKSKEELIDFILYLAQRLKAGTTFDTTIISQDNEGLEFSPMVESEVMEFTRLPTTSKAPQSEAAWRIILISPGENNKPLGFEIVEDVVVGRRGGKPSADLDLTPFSGITKGVSRFHAVLHPTKDALLLLDMGSANGSYVNGIQAVQGVPSKIDDGDIISFGMLYFKVRIMSSP